MPITAEAGADLTDRYSERRVIQSEFIYGKGYQSSGGADLARELLPRCNLKRGDRLLDLCCGNGGTSLLAASEFGYQVTGVDLSTDNISLCRSRAAEQGLKNCDFVRADARTLALPYRCKAIWCCDALMYVDRKLQLLEHVRSCLDSPSISVITDYGRGDSALSAEFENYRSFAAYDLPTLREYSDILSRAGFRVVEGINYTERFIGMMSRELAEFEQRKGDFTEAYGETEFVKFSERWKLKIRFCERRELQAFYFVVET